MVNKIVRAEQWIKELKNGTQYKVLVGFDGYVDAIVRPVFSQKSNGECEYFSTIEEFGKYIQGKAQKSCSIELKKECEKSGGNAFLFANTLAGIEVECCCMGAFGNPEVHEVFQNENRLLNLISISDPGHCYALEFMDGKVMLADNSGIEKMDYQLLKKFVGEEKILSLVENSDAVAFMNWSEVRGNDDIWKGFLSEIFPKMKGNKKKYLFVDLSDCSSREKSDLQNMLNMLKDFSAYFEVILSLNYNELQGISSLLGKLGKQDDIELEIKKNAKIIYEYCNLKFLFIHLKDCAYGLCSEGISCVETRFIQNPKLSTGGGDNFNAGLLYGLLNNMDIETAMTIGNASSGYYITRGHSASKSELLQYLKEWKQEILKEKGE